MATVAVVAGPLCKHLNPSPPPPHPPPYSLDPSQCSPSPTEAEDVLFYIYIYMRVCQTQSLAGLSVYSDFPIQKLLRLQLLINTQTTRQAGGRGGGERRHILIHAHTENIWHTHTERDISFCEFKDCYSPSQKVS